MKNLSIAIRHHISYELIKGLLDSASRGSDYWCNNGLAYESETNKALTDKGVLVRNVEKDLYKDILFNLPKIKKGLTVMAKKYPEHFADFIKEEYDQTTGDVFLQCCLFNEIIYS